MPTVVRPTAVLRELVDDAALYASPTATPVTMAAAVAAYRERHDGPYADVIRRFVCPADRVGELLRALDAGSDRHHPMPGVAPLRVALIAAAPAGLPRAMADLAADPRLVLEAVELPPPAGTSRAELSATTHQALAVVPTALPAYVELPAEGWEAALDVLAGTDRGAKLRTGGPAGPSVKRVAAVLTAAAARNVPIKATGGLHRAVRQVDGDTGQHGFLNLLLGAAAARRRADPVPALSERDGAVLAAAVATLDPVVRRLFVGFGCCDVTAPLDDLRQLGLL